MTIALITGVAGQDGAYLSRRLLADGCRVVGLRLPIPVAPELGPWLDGVELVTCDLTDPAEVADVLERVTPDEVYNLAGVSSVALSWEQPVLTAEVNGVAVVRLLELLRSTGSGARFLQASSAEIFGQPAVSPQVESTPLSPRSPYGLSKAFAHQAVGLARTVHGQHASTVILYNHESPLRPPTFVTRKITQAAAAISLGRQESLVLGSLEVSRDWGFAGDYVDAMVRALRAETPGDYIVATGEEHTLRELLAAAFSCVGIDDWTPYVTTDTEFVRPAEITSMVGDASRAREVLGWTPTTSFADMVAAMVDHDLELLRAAGPGAGS